MANKLTNTKMEDLLEKQYTKKRVVCSINEEKMTFMVATKFKPSTIGDMVDELVLYLDYIRVNELVGFKYIDLSHGLILKHFTNISLYKRVNIKDRAKINPIELMENCVKVTTSLGEIYCDNGKSVFEFLMESLDNEQISIVFSNINQVVAYLAQQIELSKTTVDLMEEMKNYVDSMSKKVELTNEIIIKMSTIDENRIFEKEEE